MTKLLEIKDKLTKIYAQYEAYIYPVVKFIVALITFLLINANLGFFTKISNPLVAILLALVCALLPTSGIIGVAAIVILLDMYALGLEVALVAFVLFVVIYFLYFRFAPKDGIAVLLTPLAFKLNIPYVMPVGTGLLRKAYSVVALICGTVVFYFLDGIKLNAGRLVEDVVDESGATSKLSIVLGAFSNKEMLLMVVLIALTTLVVYAVKRLKIDHAWTIAIIAGIVIQLVVALIGYIVLGLYGKIVWLIIGSILSAVIGIIIQFVFMNLDYQRTERVQFEDDEYYYYVKAVPKKVVAKQEKVVKHFGNTGKLANLQQTQAINIQDVLKGLNETEGQQDPNNIQQ